MTEVNTSIPIFHRDIVADSEATNNTIDTKDSRTTPLCDDEALRQKVKDYKLPGEVAAFLDEQGGIGNLMKEVIKFNPLVDVSMAYVLVIDWAHCELGLNDPALEQKVDDKIALMRRVLRAPKELKYYKIL